MNATDIFGKEQQSFFELREEGYFPASLAQWKVFTPEEQVLAENADWDEDAKRAYADFYRSNNPMYYDKGVKLIEETLRCFNVAVNSPQEKQALIVDMIYSLHRFGCTYEEYIMFNFKSLDFYERASFTCDKVRYYLYNKMNLDRNHSIFRDKYLSYVNFKKYFGREIICIKTEDDYEEFRAFFSKHESFFVKPIDSDCGKGARYIYSSDYTDCRACFDEISSAGGVLVEEKIIQSYDIGSVHCPSVNTVRMITVKNKNGVHIFHPFFRMGQNGSIVDNGGAGGLFANINPQTGICYTHGYDEFGNTYLTHPNSGIVINGFKIPRWQEAVDLAKGLAIATTNNYVGWDLALTDDGWILVEGNDCGQLLGQIADGTGYLQELLDLIEDM